MPNLTYNRDVPDGPNNPSDDQPDMKTNTNSIYDIIEVDHFTFNNDNGGHHQQVHMYNQAAPGLAGADGVLYNNVFALDSWPIWQNATGSTLIVSYPTQAPVVATDTGYASLPGGILVQWGTVINAVSQADTAVTFVGLGGAAFLNRCYGVWVTMQRAGSNSVDVIYTSNITNSGFTYRNTSGTVKNFNWLAIGN